MSYINKIDSLIEEKRKQFIQLSDRIWEYAETRFTEHQSSAALCEMLEQEGFKVERGVGGIETAFIASFGAGSPVIAILGEYDALSGMSQKEGTDEYAPLDAGGNGHGCGHNLLGTAALAGAVAAKRIMEESGISGTIRYYGCPGEEGGSGKTFMVKEGLFDDVDCALTWHPSSFSGLFSFSTLANYQIYFKFQGTAAHAANSPYLGRSALDAVELMNIGVNYLREHIIPEARIHYAITNTGGVSPNVVQSEAEVLYLIRAPQLSEVKAIYERVLKIAEGAALMTETNVKSVFDKACSNYIPNHTIGTIMEKNLQSFGLPDYLGEEHEFAEKILSKISPEDKLNTANEINKISGKKQSVVLKTLGDNPFFGEVFPFQPSDEMLFGSTDVGDVSWVVPTSQFFGASLVAGTPLHSWQLVSQGKTAIGHKGMLQAGKVLAATALDLLTDKETVSRAKEELKNQKTAEYVSPIPDGVRPSPLKR